MYSDSEGPPTRSLLLADILRWIARVISVVLILCIVPYVLFVGLQLPGSGHVLLAFLLYLLILAATCAGLIIAWWREALGALIVLAAMMGSIVPGRLLPGFTAPPGPSLLIGPLTLLAALTVPGYHPDVSPIAGSIRVASWVLTLTPVVLFFSSWLIRRKELEPVRPDQLTKGVA